MREKNLAQVRERTAVRDHLLYLGFTAAIGAHSISEEVARFYLYGFLEEIFLCLLSLVFIYVHVILLDKILISDCLNDKNITWYHI